MEPLLSLLVLVLIVLVVGLLARPFVSIVTVHDYERGLRYRRGRFTGLVDAGTHLSVRPFTEIQVLDARPSSLVLEGQEILTSDGVALKISLAGRYVIGDPVAAVTGDRSWMQAMYLTLQLALRRAVEGRTADDLLAGRREIGPAIHAATASDLARIGLELLAVEVRDVMVPGDLKRAFAGVIAARREGEAALERARGETAALRNLANAGRLVEDSPGLLQLRVLQQLGGSSGNTVMLGMPDGVGSATGAARSTGRGRGRGAPPPSEE